jgi:F0F1-type ATP synthase delta subunit
MNRRKLNDLATAIIKSAHETNAVPEFMAEAKDIGMTLVSDGFIGDYGEFMAALSRAAADAGFHVVKVVSAIPLDDDERQKILKLAKAKLGGSCHLEETVDPKILGGLVVSSGDWQVDASLKGKLDRLRYVLQS